MPTSLTAPTCPVCDQCAVEDNDRFFYCPFGHKIPRMQIDVETIKQYLAIDRIMPEYVKRIVFNDERVTVEYTNGETIDHDDIDNAAWAIESWINYGAQD